MAVAAVALVLNKCMKNGETCYAFHIKFPYYSPTCPTTTHGTYAITGIIALACSNEFFLPPTNPHPQVTKMPN